MSLKIQENKTTKNLYNGIEGSSSLFKKHYGKALYGLAAATTILGVANACHITNKPSKVKGSDVLDKNKESVVS